MQRDERPSGWRHLRLARPPPGSAPPEHARPQPLSAGPHLDARLLLSQLCRGPARRTGVQWGGLGQCRSPGRQGRPTRSGAVRERGGDGPERGRRPRSPGSPQSPRLYFPSFLVGKTLSRASASGGAGLRGGLATPESCAGPPGIGSSPSPPLVSFSPPAGLHLPASTEVGGGAWRLRVGLSPPPSPVSTSPPSPLGLRRSGRLPAP